MILHTFRPRTPRAYGEIWDALVRRNYIIGNYNPLPRIVLQASRNADVEVFFTERWAWLFRNHVGFKVDNKTQRWWRAARRHRKHILLLQDYVSPNACQEFCKTLLKENRP